MITTSLLLFYIITILTITTIITTQSTPLAIPQLSPTINNNDIPPLLHNNDLDMIDLSLDSTTLPGWQEPTVYLFVHPYGLSDDFLSIDCMIRSTQFLPTDKFSIILSPLHDSSQFGEEQSTPFSKVYITPFIEGKQSAEVLADSVDPIEPRILERPTPFPSDKLTNTENWISFHFWDVDHEPHELLQLNVFFEYNTTHPDTGALVRLNKTRSFVQKGSLANKLLLENYRVENRAHDDESIKNEFEITFEMTHYSLKSIELALHGNHNFDGDFSTCEINNERIERAFQKDVGVNLTVSNTHMGSHTDMNYTLRCPNAYINSYNISAFSLQSVLSVSGQPQQWEDSDTYPAIGIVIGSLVYYLQPNYFSYWLTVAGLLISSTILSFIIVRCWGLDDKTVMVT